MLRNRFVLSVVAVGIGAIVVVSFLIFAGKIATRNYPTSPVATSSAPAAK